MEKQRQGHIHFGPKEKRACKWGWEMTTYLLVVQMKYEDCSEKWPKYIIPPHSYYRTIFFLFVLTLLVVLDVERIYTSTVIINTK